MAQNNSFVGLGESDRVIIGGGLGPASPTIVEFYGNIGVDFAFLDLEHSGFSAWNSPKLEEFTARAELAGVDLLVRLPSGDASDHPQLIRKVLDTGVRNILIPRIEEAEEVRTAVEAARYQYDGGLGERGIGGGRATAYGSGMDSDYIENEDESVTVGVMIENTTAIDNLDEILAVPDLGFGFIGNMDLSHSVGQPTNITHPDVQDAVSDIEAAFADSPVALGAMFFDPDDVQGTVDRGYQLLMGGSPMGAAAEHFDSLLDDVDEELEEYSR